ncbi:MAG: Uma2 family endonuclease [Myxococcota bacterium]
MDPARKPATYEDLLAVPDRMVAEIVSGRLHASQRPAPRHSQAASGIGADIYSAYHRGRGGPGGWWSLGEPELHLGGDVLVPDIAGWRVERLPALPETAYFEVAPNWLCEVLSPSTGRLDRTEKLPAYARQSIQHVWLVDPLQQTLEVFENRNHEWVLIATHAGAETFRAKPFEEVEFELAPLWTTRA